MLLCIAKEYGIDIKILPVGGEFALELEDWLAGVYAQVFLAAFRCGYGFYVLHPTLDLDAVVFPQQFEQR